MDGRDDEFKGEIKATLDGIKEDIREIKESLKRIEGKADENAKAIASISGASRMIYVIAGVLAAIIAAAIQAIASAFKR